MMIEKANQSNLDEVCNLAMKLWPDHNRRELRTEFEEILDSKKDIIYVAVVQGVYVGFIHLSLRFDYVEGSRSSPVGYVEGIYVDEKYRNRGISRKLVEAGERWAKSLGCSEMASDTELTNVESLQFHKKIGFKEAGRIVAFIKDIE